MTIEEIKLANSQDINSRIATLKSRGQLRTKDISDGYHTFGDLYTHRYILYIKFCESYFYQKKYSEDGCYTDELPWRSKFHSDGTPSFGNNSFVLGIGKKTGQQITYHLPISYWDDCQFATELAVAPEFDGHTSEQVLERIKQL